MAEGPVLEVGVCSETARIPEGHLPPAASPQPVLPDSHQSSSGRGTRYSGPRFVVVYFQPYYLPTIQFPEAIVQRA